jgi:hypothetical protein
MVSLYTCKSEFIDAHIQVRPSLADFNDTRNAEQQHVQPSYTRTGFHADRTVNAESADRGKAKSGVCAPICARLTEAC